MTGNYQAVDWSKCKSEFSHSDECNFYTPVNPNCVDLVLGINYPEFHQSLKEVSGKTGEAAARLGPLGWTAVRKVKPRLSYGLNITAVKCCNIDNTLQRMMSIEVPKNRVDRRKIMSLEERKAMDILEQTTK